MSTRHLGYRGRHLMTAVAAALLVAAVVLVIIATRAQSHSAAPPASAAHTAAELAIANIGDSRAYLVRDGVFTQITKDHSLVQSLPNEGRITPEEAEQHPQRSFVTRVLIGRADNERDLSLREARIGDCYLICSDGLSDYVAGSTIEDIVDSSDPTSSTPQIDGAAAARATASGKDHQSSARTTPA